MAQADVQLPDGRVGTIEFPDNWSDDQLNTEIQRMFESGAFDRRQPAQPEAAPAPTTPAPTTPAQPGADVSGMTLRPFGIDTGIELPESVAAGLVGAGRGLTTVARGIGLAEPETPEVTRAIEQLKEERPVATIGGEILGESAPFLIPGAGVGRVASTAGRVATTGALGAAEAGVITRGQGGDVGEQFRAAGVGGTVAGALELALPVLGRIGGKIVRRVMGRAPKGAVVDASGKPSQEFLDALAESGQTYDDVVAEATRELKGQAVDPRQAARKAFFESQGLEPTRAQITRNASDFQAQQEAAKTSNRVRDALERQDAILTTRFNNKVLETGGRANSPTSTVVDAVTEKATKLDQEIGDLYRLADQRASGAKNIRFQDTVDTLRKLAPADRRAGGNIRAILGDLQSRGIINKKFKPIGQIDVKTAEEVRKYINSLWDDQNPFANSLLRQIKDSLDDDVFRATGDDVFEQARQAKTAFERELARAKISKFDSRRQNLVRDILENKIDPDQMVDKVVFGKSWRSEDLQQLKDYITTGEAGKQAFNDMRAEVLHQIKENAFIGPVDEQGFQMLSRDKLEKALSKIGQKKMNILFNNEEQKFLKDMLELAKLREPVRGTAMGRGPTAQAVGRIEQKLKDLPILGSLVDLINVDAQGRVAIRANPKRIAAPIYGPSAARTAAGAPVVAATAPEQEQ